MGKLVLICNLKAKADCEAKLEEVLNTLAQSTYAESGCLFYTLHRDSADSATFVLIEGWTSKEALEAHFNTPHFLQQFPIISSLIASPPELTYLSPLTSGKDTKGSLFLQK